jgi:hypothetical protein
MADRNAGTPSVPDVVPGSTAAMPPFAAQASRRDIAALDGEKTRILHRRPVRVFTSLFASCARSTLSKIENEASSDTGSAHALLGPAIDIKKEHRPRQPSPGQASNSYNGSPFITDNLLANQPWLQI